MNNMAALESYQPNIYIADTLQQFLEDCKALHIEECNVYGNSLIRLDNKKSKEISA
jgi:hypothetical protein